MIKTKGHKVTFSGEDLAILKRESKRLGLSPQNWFTGMLWEMVMREARNGAFKKDKKVVVT